MNEDEFEWEIEEFEEMEEEDEMEEEEEMEEVEEMEEGDDEKEVAETVQNISTQTNAIQCAVCTKNAKKVNFFDTLEKEHMDVKFLYEKIRVAYHEQADEKQVLKEKIQELEANKCNQAKEIVKMKREGAGMKKNFELKVLELENKLKESYAKVNETEQENVLLREEKRTLEELRKIDKEKETSAVPDAQIEEEEMEADVIDMEDNDPDDDEVIAFYLSQSLNKTKRTTPMSEAVKDKTAAPTDDQVCDVCTFKTNRKDILLAHKKAKHQELPNPANQNQSKIKCDKCDFVSSSPDQSKKHFEVRHKDNPNCWYWCNSICRNNVCRFEHPSHGNQANQQERNDGYQNQRTMRIPCYYQERCRKPNCHFEHFLAQSQNWSQRW